MPAAVFSPSAWNIETEVLLILFRTLLTIIASYVLGAIPSGYLAAKLIKGVDVTQVGSGRIGGSNVLRAAGVVPAILTVLGDLGKGYGAVALAGLIAPGIPLAPVLAGLSAVGGHNWSVFLGFDGGVGTATTFGAALALLPLPAGVAIATGALVVLIWRHTSLGSITFALVLMLASIVSGAAGATPMDRVLFAVGTSAMALWELRPNIARLRQGTERKLGEYIPAGKKDTQRHRPQ